MNWLKKQIWRNFPKLVPFVCDHSRIIRGISFKNYVPFHVMRCEYCGKQFEREPA